MKLIRPTPEEGAAGLRAMITVARSRGEVAAPTRRLIEAAQKVLLGSSESLDGLAPIAPEELAAAIPLAVLQHLVRNVQQGQVLVRTGLVQRIPPLGHGDGG